MHQKAQPGLSFVVLFLHKLVIPGSSPKLGWKESLQQLKEVAVEVIHPLAGEFLVASDTMQVKRQAYLFQGAAAISPLQRSVVSIPDI